MLAIAATPDHRHPDEQVAGRGELVRESTPLAAHEQDQRLGVAHGAVFVLARRRGADDRTAVGAGPGGERRPARASDRQSEHRAAAGANRDRVKGVGRAAKQEHAAAADCVARAQHRAEVARVPDPGEREPVGRSGGIQSLEPDQTRPHHRAEAR